MPSPFPGMNPFLEHDDVGRDFHCQFVVVASELIEQQVGENYFVKLGERGYFHELPDEPRRLVRQPDAFIAISGNSSEYHRARVTAAPERGLLPTVDEERLSFIEIRDRRDRSVVTVIELLSWSNKRIGPHREQYLAKRLQVLHSWTHFVELDLLRGEPPMPLQDLPPCDYYALVSRYEERPAAGIWPIQLRDRLPVIPIPLKAPDADVFLDLQLALNEVYDRAGYHKYIYESSPSPPLGEADADWATRFISTH